MTQLFHTIYHKVVTTMGANEAKLATLNGPFFKASHNQQTFLNLLMDESFGAVRPERRSFSGTFCPCVRNAYQFIARFSKTDENKQIIIFRLDMVRLRSGV